MKSLLLVLFIMLAGSFVITPVSLFAKEVGTQQVIILTKNDGNITTPQNVAMNEMLEIKLKNNPSIGNSWSCDQFSQQGILHCTFPAEGSPEHPEKTYLPGASQPYVWDFQPTALGIITISFTETDRYGNVSSSILFNINVVPAAIPATPEPDQTPE